jgi:hypothetical protein
MTQSDSESQTKPGDGVEIGSVFGGSPIEEFHESQSLWVSGVWGIPKDNVSRIKIRTIARLRLNACPIRMLVFDQELVL